MCPKFKLICDQMWQQQKNEKLRGETFMDCFSARNVLKVKDKRTENNKEKND